MQSLSRHWQLPFISDIDECATNTSGCSQACTNNDGSFNCACDEGYELLDNERTCRDINECLLGVHDCQQLCVNTDGGFKCECNSGFQLNSDQNTCSGMSLNLLSVHSDIDECSTNGDPLHTGSPEQVLRRISIFQD